MPTLEARFTTSSIVNERSLDPIDMEATEPRKPFEPFRLEWLVIIQSIPLMMSLVVPLAPDNTLTAIMLAALATPKVVEPAVPAVCVPWPSLSV